MTQTGPGTSLLDHFSALTDPRQVAKVLFPLPEILLLVLAATLAGADDFVDVQAWGEERLAFLRRFLPYANGIPSHDTLNGVINALDPELFRRCFVTWVDTLRTDQPDFVAIDGKTSPAATPNSRAASLCTSCPPGRAISGWCSARRRSPARRTRSPRSRGCSSGSSSPVPS